MLCFYMIIQTHIQQEQRKKKKKKKEFKLVNSIPLAIFSRLLLV